MKMVRKWTRNWSKVKQMAIKKAQNDHIFGLDQVKKWCETGEIEKLLDIQFSLPEISIKNQGKSVIKMPWKE